MQLTEEVKKQIDKMDYIDMLRRWRFAPCGDVMLQGESGGYYSIVMGEKKKTVDHVKASKEIGW